MWGNQSSTLQAPAVPASQLQEEVLCSTKSPALMLLFMLALATTAANTHMSDVDVKDTTEAMLCGQSVLNDHCLQELGFSLGVNQEWAWDGTHGRATHRPPTPDISQSLDLRVVKAYGSKGYDKLRISVVTRTAVANDTNNGLFTYSHPFRYRWTQLFLRSGLLTVTPGQETTLNIDGMTVRLRLPQENAGVRGIVFADPCIGSPWLNCSLGVETFLTATRLPALLNAAAPQLDYWATWGDNFYDKNGSVSTQFFAQLSQEVKSRVFFSAAGNHDFWVSGSPNHSQPDDQFGNGYMQYYAMDSAASQDPSQPFNFSVSPDGTVRVFRQKLTLEDQASMRVTN
jgi:hypothetical protein